MCMSNAHFFKVSLVSPKLFYLLTSKISIPFGGKVFYKVGWEAEPKVIKKVFQLPIAASKPH